jgi:hexokinase
VNCLHKFLDEQGLADANLPVGFVFSYPCELLSIRSARLLWWTKGFNVEDCLQKDVVKLLEDALSLNPEVKVRVKAVMNDTVGQLAAAGFKYGHDCTVGVVMGYGCNASYLEDVSRIKKFDPEKTGYKYPQMVVVTEWEEFGEKGELDSILTPFDREIDELSVHKGKQIVDKLCGALYLGEVVRLVMDQLTVDGVMFGGRPCDNIQTRDGFPSKYISEILQDDESTHFKNTRRILDELQVPLHGSADYLILRELCHAVSERSAAIAAAAIAALLKHLERPRVVIGVGGALVHYHPTFEALLEKKLSLLAPEGVEWKVVPIEDGSGRGAALVAALADKMKL